MNVLLMHERFLPDFGGGGEYIVYETARHLLRRGIGVRVLTTGDSRMTDYGGVPTVRLPASRSGFNLAAREAVALARDADLIHACTYHALLPSVVAGRVCRKPVVCQVLGLFHEGWKEMRGPVRGRALMAVERFLVTRRFARTLFLSEYSRDLGVALGADPARAVVNSPGIDWSEEPAPQAKCDEVLFAGKLERRKGIHDLLDVAGRLPHVRFRVLGWGGDAPHLASAAPVNVTFAGFQQGRARREAFARARIFFFPSRAETFGLVIAEAMAAGCAIVSTIPLAFEGVRVAPGDRAAMISALGRLWDDPEETDRMGRRNAELARVYTWERYTDRLLSLYADVLTERTRAIGVRADARRLKASVVIPARNRSSALERTVRALWRQTIPPSTFEIVIVDNASADDTPRMVERLAQESPVHLRYHRVDRDGGPAAARNVGARLADAGALVFLDSDVELDPAWIDIAASYLDGHPDVGIVAGKLLYGRRDSHINMFGGELSRIGLAWDAHEGEPSIAADAAEARLWTPTSAAMVRRDLLERIGLFDERFYFGFEDSDLGWRANLSGSRCVCLPDLVARHHATPAGRTAGRSIVFHYTKNRLRSMLKNYSPASLAVYVPLYLAYSACELVLRPGRRERCAALLWNVAAFGDTWRERGRVQRLRRRDDAELLPYFSRRLLPPATLAARRRRESTLLHARRVPADGPAPSDPIPTAQTGGLE